MSKRAPSTLQLIVIAAFALSCFGILLFLWVTFGGPTPFKAKSYEIKVPFREATQLAQQSDVRISGVSVGKVQDITVSPDGQQALATLLLDDKYGPIPLDTRAILRTKTLLGETYVELTPGNGRGRPLADGGTLPTGNVAESVQLDEIFRTFDARTRTAFQEWMQYSASAIAGRGQGLSMALGEFEPTFADLDRLFRVLDTQRLAVGQLFRNGAATFRALRGPEGELANLISNSDAVFRTMAARDSDIEALFRAFPTFLDESRLTFNRLRTFAVNTDPVVRQLVPAARELSPTLIALSKFAPEAKGFFEGFAPVIARAPTAFPALRKLFRDEFPPLLRAIDPFARNLNPILVGLNLYRRELAAVMANVAAATNAVHLGSDGTQIHYLRALGPFGPESLATFQNRLTNNRHSAYSQPLAGKNLASGLASFDTRQCSSGIAATIDPNTATDPDFTARFPEPNQAREATKFFEHLKHYAYADQTSSAALPAPPCVQQAPFAPIYGSGPPTSYQHTFEQPAK